MSQSPEINGYCPVAYFTAAKAVKGRPEFAVPYQGRVYHCASEAAKAEFVGNSDRYVPAYGGYCAFGMSIEKELEPCPHTFKIIDDRLYLFLCTDDVNALLLWNGEDETKCLSNANRHWAGLQRSDSSAA